MRENKGSNKNRIIGIIFLAVGLIALIQWLGQNYGHAIAWEQLLYPLALLVLFSGGIWTALRKDPGFFLRGAMGWLLIFVALYVGYVQYENYQTKQALTKVEGQAPDLILTSRNNHFYVDVTINNKIIKAMIDTGASDVVLTEDDARRVGIVLEDITDFRAYSTANGDIISKYTRLDEISINNITVKDVRTSISEVDLNQSLIGQSFLNKLSKWQVIKGNEMHIWQ